VSETLTLLLTETGVEHLPDGSAAVNVGPIVRALKFLTEGRGDDRGTDEAGNPLPDLMSLAFAVVESIIVGGRKAEYFRQVMRDLESQDGFGRSSLALAKQARRIERAAPASALDHAGERLEELLDELRATPLEGQAASNAANALEAFNAFGIDRWVSASAQLLLALSALQVAVPQPATEPSPRPARRRPTKPKPRSKPAPRSKPKAKARPKPQAKTKPSRAAKKRPKKA
jgi:cell division septation protein DedD